jgi:hypothetical protein
MGLGLYILINVSFLLLLALLTLLCLRLNTRPFTVMYPQFYDRVSLSEHKRNCMVWQIIQEALISEGLLCVSTVGCWYGVIGAS